MRYKRRITLRIFCAVLLVPTVVVSLSLFSFGEWGPVVKAYASSEVQGGSGNPPPPEGSSGNPPPTEGSSGNPPPTEGSSGNPPPAEGSSGNPPPTEGSSGNPPPTEGSSGNPPPGGSSGNPPPEDDGEDLTESVEAVAICYEDTGDVVSRATVGGSSSGTIQIRTKGQTLTFDSLVYWTDFSTERDLAFVSWSTSDPSIATISPAGVLTPLKDGVVELRAAVPGAYVATGSDLIAVAQVEIFGQSDGRYITAIRIVDGAGNQYGQSSPYILEETLATAMVQFYAQVDVFDPATETTQTYSTDGGGYYSKLSDQLPDISDIVWYVGDTSTAGVEPAIGLYRPIRFGVNWVYAETRATLDNTALTAVAAVSSLNPDGIGEDGYNPQSAITVKAYYELLTPEANGDEAYVVDETYSVADMEQMGTFVATYTALANDGYYTMTGRGVPFATLLKESGINLDAVSGFKFGSSDGYGNLFISKNFLFSARYYYPNIFFDSQTDAVQVPPMLALESNMIRDGRTTPNHNMSDGTRFRLLIGAQPYAATSSYAIKWVHTVYVILSGGPKVGDNDPDNDGAGEGDDEGDESGNGNPGGADDGTGPGDGDATGDGSGIYGGGGTDDSDGSGDETGAAGGTAGEGTTAEITTGEVVDGPEIVNENEAESQSESENVDADAIRPSHSFNIYQVMNKNDSLASQALVPDNPFKPYALPGALAVFAIGGFSAVFWYRRQTEGTWANYV